MNPELVLEISNGVGFVLMIVLFITLTAILISHYKRWGYDFVSQLTVGMMLMKIGVAAILAYGWLYRRCLNSGGDCTRIEDEYWIVMIATVAIAAAGLMLMRILSRPTWQPWTWVGAGTASIIIPFTYYAFDLMFPTRFGWLAKPTGTVVSGVYALDRVALSVLIAVLGSYVALDLACRAGASTRKSLWVAASGLVFGGSIWSMHFVAMLAFELPGVAILYDPTLTALSLALPIFFTLVGVFAAVNSPHGVIYMMMSALLISFGVVAMHYVGMAAVEMNAFVSYDLMWVLISVVLGFIGSFAAVWLVFQDSTILQRVAASVIMGTTAISGLHYSAMAGYICRVVSKDNVDVARPLAGLTQGQLAFAIGAVTLVILAAFFALTIFDRRRKRVGPS